MDLQGLCVAFLFCFCNGEVLQVLRKEVLRHAMSRRVGLRNRRLSSRSQPPLTTELWVAAESNNLDDTENQKECSIESICISSPAVGRKIYRSLYSFRDAYHFISNVLYANWQWVVTIALIRPPNNMASCDNKNACVSAKMVLAIIRVVVTVL